MKTAREILLQKHQSVAPKLDAIRNEVTAGLSRSSVPETVSWRDFLRSLRWHFAALSAAWVVVMILNIDQSPGAVAMIPRDKIPTPQQLWASLQENRRLLLEYGDFPAEQAVVVPGRRSEIEPQQAVV